VIDARRARWDRGGMTSTDKAHPLAALPVVLTRTSIVVLGHQTSDEGASTAAHRTAEFAVCVSAGLQNGRLPVPQVAATLDLVGRIGRQERESPPYWDFRSLQEKQPAIAARIEEAMQQRLDADPDPA
jgi:hypothetical protein